MFYRRIARRYAQVENGYGAAANMGNAFHHLAGVRHLSQLGALEHFFNFKNVNAVNLIAIEAEQQQFQAVCPTNCVRWFTLSRTPAIEFSTDNTVNCRTPSPTPAATPRQSVTPL